MRTLDKLSITSLLFGIFMALVKANAKWYGSPVNRYELLTPDNVMLRNQLINDILSRLQTTTQLPDTILLSNLDVFVFSRLLESPLALPKPKLTYQSKEPISQALTSHTFKIYDMSHIDLSVVFGREDCPITKIVKAYNLTLTELKWKNIRYLKRKLFELG